MSMPETSPTRSPSTGDLLIASLLAVLLILPLAACNRSAAMSPQDAAASSYAERCGGEPESIMIRDLDGRTKIKVEHGRCRLEIEMEGDVDFLADESGIERMGREAYLEIEERIRRQRWRLEVAPGEGGEGGQPEYAWFVNRGREDFDDEARAWLREILPQVFRITGIDADRRVERILARDGTEGVLREINLIPGDHVQRLYFQELIGQTALSATELERVIRLAGREISSDYELAEILIGISHVDLDADATRTAYVTAAREIDSDYELRRTLAVLERSTLTPEMVVALLESSRALGSDYELAEFLVKLVRAYPIDDALRPPFMAALATVGSERERERVSAALERSTRR